MLVLVEGEKRKVFERQSDREAGVFSSRKPRNKPDWRGDNKPWPQSKPVVSLNTASYKRTEKTEDEVPAASEEPVSKEEQVKPEESISCVTENFQAFVTQLRDTMMDTEESLQEMVELIFERAMQRPNSAGLFAELCQLLSTVNVPSDSVSFRSLLVKHCQAEYRKSFVMEDISQKGSFLDPVRDVRVLDRLREERNNASPSPRSLNTIRFLGELFKSKVLGEKVMHSCIKRLLQNGDGPSLESLCELLHLIQQDLEVVTSRKVMDSYCHQLEFIAQEGKRSRRLSLLLKDTVDARKRAGSTRH
ncbi:eukaryotic translation initiation factor 4 gamma 3-like [Paralichthys olivaceus]|uniref:eukaryotic translation initiation factor 4 gamma 3-like n=1 Tax=Paralichthys olivaceus TaxID=8255 RepID=UPI003753CDC5